MFFYKAQNLQGNVIKGKYYGCDLNKLQCDLRNRGFYITDLKKMGILYLKDHLIKVKMTYEDLYIFSEELSTLIHSGIKLPMAVELLVDCFKKNKIKSCIKDISDNLYRGKSLYSSMKKYEYVFDKFLLNMINIGENTGRLEYILKQTASYYKKIYKIQYSIKKSVSYPKFIFCTFIVICFLIFKLVLPEFIKIGEGFNLKNDMIIFKIYKIFHLITSTFTKTSITFLFILGIILYIKRNKQNLRGYILNKIPYFKKKYLKYKITWMFKSISIMMQSGVSLVDSLEKCYEISYDLEIKKIVNRIKNNLIRGSTFSEAIGDEDFINKRWKTIIQIGEETATLDESLMKITENYEESLLKNIEVATKFIEPIMIIIIAILVGMLAISLMTPIIEITDSII